MNLQVMGHKELFWSGFWSDRYAGGILTDFAVISTFQSYFSTTESQKKKILFKAGSEVHLGRGDD